MKKGGRGAPPRFPKITFSATPPSEKESPRRGRRAAPDGQALESHAENSAPPGKILQPERARPPRKSVDAGCPDIPQRQQQGPRRREKPCRWGRTKSGMASSAEERGARSLGTLLPRFPTPRSLPIGDTATTRARRPHRTPPSCPLWR